MSPSLTIAVSNQSLFDETAFFLSSLDGAEVVRVDEANVGPSAIAGLTDLAVLNPTTIIAANGLYDVYPYFGISSWGEAGVNILLPGGLESGPTQLVVPESLSSFESQARIILRENYGFNVAVTIEDAATEHAAVLVLGPPEADGLVLDLAQEWSEAENYPLVLGLLVSRMDSQPEGTRRLLEEINERLAPTSDRDDDDVLALPRIRFGFDDLITASLTALSEHLFYYNITDEIQLVKPIAIDIPGE